MKVLQELEATMNRLPHMLDYAEIAIPCYVSGDSLSECFANAGDVYCNIQYITRMVGGGYEDVNSFTWRYAIPVHMVNKIMLRTLDLALDYCDVPSHKLVNQWQRDAIELIDLIEGLD